MLLGFFYEAGDFIYVIYVCQDNAMLPSLKHVRVCSCFFLCGQDMRRCGTKKGLCNLKDILKSKHSFGQQVPVVGVKQVQILHLGNIQTRTFPLGPERRHPQTVRK